jgi:hypothetical protein
MQQDCSIPAIMALCRRHEFQAAVLVLVVVPLHKFQRPVPRLLDTGERPARTICRADHRMALALQSWQCECGTGSQRPAREVQVDQKRIRLLD